ncbi:hypothetical protein MRX96_038799 [Rhipicephalus microplus]
MRDVGDETRPLPLLCAIGRQEAAKAGNAQPHLFPTKVHIYRSLTCATVCRFERKYAITPTEDPHCGWSDIVSYILVMDAGVNAGTSTSAGTAHNSEATVHGARILRGETRQVASNAQVTTAASCAALNDAAEKRSPTIRLKSAHAQPAEDR